MTSLKINMQKRKRSTTLYHLLFVSLLLVLCIGFGIGMLHQPAQSHQERFDMVIVVGDNPEPNLVTGAMSLGNIHSGESSIQWVEVVNPYKKQKEVNIHINGILKQWTDISDNDFILKPNERKEVFFNITAPKGTETGSYISLVIITFK